MFVNSSVLGEPKSFPDLTFFNTSLPSLNKNLGSTQVVCGENFSSERMRPILPKNLSHRLISTR